MDAPHENTSIHTRITSKVRISSIRRRYETLEGGSWGWETFVWDGDKIIDQLDLPDDVSIVFSAHRVYCDEYLQKIKGVE